MSQATTETLGATEGAASRAEVTGRPQSSLEAVAEAGARIGRYVVLSRLGAGAMGLVLAAYDPELDRKVALKLLIPRGHDQADAQLRLQREAQALAKLGHPHVVAVHDVGIHEGRVFVAMEFVDGQTLGTWMRDGPPSWTRVVQVFVDAGRGLAAAHGAGLVHRDFKPENVMLGEDGRVRVMDFGLARAQGDGDPSGAGARLETESLARDDRLSSPLTRTGALLGTPAYMSPEQLGGLPADAKSDQFSYCVALHEALYGERPFAGRSLPQLLDAMSRGEPSPLPRGTAVPSWLRRVVLRGLAADPEQRFASMHALLDALGDDPAVRRRKRWRTAALVMAMGSGGWGLAVAVSGSPPPCAGMEASLADVWTRERKSEVQAAISGTEVHHAAQTWARVETRLDAYVAKWVDARTEACEATQRGEQSAELLDLRMACLDERLTHVRATVAVLAEADATVVNEAVETIAGLPRLDRCANMEALRAEVPPPEDPAVAERVAALRTQLVEAATLVRAGKYEQAGAIAEAVAAAAEALHYQPLQAHAWLRQAAVQRRTGEGAEAEATLQRAYAAALAHRMSEVAAEASSTLITTVGHDLGRPHEGRRWAVDAEPLSRAAGTDEARAFYFNALGVLAGAEGRHEEAREHLEHALAIWENVLGSDHPELASVLGNLGAVAASSGDREAARSYFERGLAMTERAKGTDHPDVAAFLLNLGAVCRQEGDLDRARDVIERGVVILESALGPDHPDLAYSLTNLGSLAWSRRDYASAGSHYRRALALRERALGPEHPLVAASLHNLGVVAAKQREHARARELYARALSIRERALGPDHLEVASTLTAMGLAAIAQGDHEQAHRDHARALAILEEALPPDDPRIAATLTALGDAQVGLQDAVGAVAHLERALSIYDAREPAAEVLAETRFALARALWEAPPEGGRDRRRARTLAMLAREAYASAGEVSADALEQTNAWLGAHTE